MTSKTDELKIKLLFSEDISIRFGDGSGDGKAHCDLKDIEDFVSFHQTNLINDLIGSVKVEKKTLAYRQGRELPVLTGIEQKDPDHVKVKKYINHGFNKAVNLITKILEDKKKELK